MRKGDVVNFSARGFLREGDYFSENRVRETVRSLLVKCKSGGHFRAECENLFFRPQIVVRFNCVFRCAVIRRRETKNPSFRRELIHVAVNLRAQ